jgi:hypothetical protein
LTRLLGEASDVLNNVHLLGLATVADNSSRGVKPLSFVTFDSQKTFRRRPNASGDENTVNYVAETMAEFLYNPNGFSDVRKAAVARVTACAFLTYPLLSDSPSYAGWPAGQLGSGLYSAQWVHLKDLLTKKQPTEWEQRLDWMQWYRFGWNNPLIHDMKLMKTVEDLLNKRLSGTDAVSMMVYEAMFSRTWRLSDVENDIVTIEAEIKRLETPELDMF